MPRQRYDLEVKPHPDGRLVWIVTSRSRPEIEHRVDLAAFGGIGRCSCEHFEFRIAPDLREGRRVGAHRCSHILAARQTLCDATIQILSQQENGPGPDPTVCPHCGDEIETPGQPACEFCTWLEADENDQDP